MNLLIVEDEPKVASFLKKGLEENGYEVELAFDGKMGERLALTKSFDLIILDVILPYINGIELCKIIREKNLNIPILMLTALGTLDDKISGFDAGSDDYLVKPFEFNELLIRVKALLKRSQGTPQGNKTLRIDNLTLDLEKMTAKRGETQIELTAKEFNLLEFLLRNKGKIMSRAAIAEQVWEITFDTGTNVVDVYINLLRKKIDKNFDKKLIQTKIGIGYMIND